MAISKAWAWEKEGSDIWLKPSEESYASAQRWEDQGYHDLLDFGCGLGRHSIYFAKKGFCVTAFDLSEHAVAHTAEWAGREGLQIRASVEDMLALPYADQSFDAIFAYHVISHTDSKGMEQIRDELYRMLRPGGEAYLTLCSKETWSFCEAGYPRLDENTVVKTDEGPEEGIPHFFVNLDDILSLFSQFKIERVRHTDDCYFDGGKRLGKHYFILLKKER